MKKLILAALLVLVASPAWCTGPGKCVSVSVAASPTSTQIFTAGTDLYKYVMVQNQGSCAIYCALGSANTASTTNGTKLAPDNGYGGGVWQPTAPVPAQDLACAANACTAQVYSCIW